MKYIIYRFLSCKLDHGTANAPDSKQVILEKTLPYSEETLQIAKSEAIDGAYTIEDREDPPASLTLEERITALEKNVSVASYTPGTWYYRGDRVTFDGAIYTCIAPDGTVCVWSPLEYPQYWAKTK